MPQPCSQLIERVTQRPLTLATLTCPVCNNPRVELQETQTTLVGGGPEFNHVWWKAYCVGGGHDFKVESKGSNYWVVQDGAVLAGLPNCFEDYILTCAACEGPVRRKQTALDGLTLVKTLGTKRDADGKWVKQYRTFWKCHGSCGWSLETDTDYYQPAK